MGCVVPPPPPYFFWGVGRAVGPKAAHRSHLGVGHRHAVGQRVGQEDEGRHLRRGAAVGRGEDGVQLRGVCGAEMRVSSSAMGRGMWGSAMGQGAHPIAMLQGLLFGVVGGEVEVGGGILLPVWGREIGGGPKCLLWGRDVWGRDVWGRNVWVSPRRHQTQSEANGDDPGGLVILQRGVGLVVAVGQSGGSSCPTATHGRPPTPPHPSAP